MIFQICRSVGSGLYRVRAALPPRLDVKNLPALTDVTRDIKEHHLPLAVGDIISFTDGRQFLLSQRSSLMNFTALEPNFRLTGKKTFSKNHNSVMFDKAYERVKSIERLTGLESLASSNAAFLTDQLKGIHGFGGEQMIPGIGYINDDGEIVAAGRNNNQLKTGQNIFEITCEVDRQELVFIVPRSMRGRHRPEVLSTTASILLMSIHQANRSIARFSGYEQNYIFGLVSLMNGVGHDEVRNMLMQNEIHPEISRETALRFLEEHRRFLEAEGADRRGGKGGQTSEETPFRQAIKSMVHLFEKKKEDEGETANRAAWKQTYFPPSGGSGDSMINRVVFGLRERYAFSNILMDELRLELLERPRSSK